MTFPRLLGLMKARETRKRQELLEMGRVMAVAFNEPNKLDEVLKPSVGEIAHTAANDSGAWDEDEWWKDQSA